MKKFGNYTVYAFHSIDAEEELTRLLQQEIEKAVFEESFGIGDYTIKQIIGLFKRKQLMNRYAKKHVNPKFYSKIKI